MMQGEHNFREGQSPVFSNKGRICPTAAVIGQGPMTISIGPIDFSIEVLGPIARIPK